MLDCQRGVPPSLTAPSLSLKLAAGSVPEEEGEGLHRRVTGLSLLPDLGWMGGKEIPEADMPPRLEEVMAAVAACFTEAGTVPVPAPGQEWDLS